MKTKKLFLIIALVIGCAVGPMRKKRSSSFATHRHVQVMRLLKFVSNLQLSR